MSRGGSIVGMLDERFQDVRQFEFLDFVNQKHGILFDILMLQSQISFVYNDKDTLENSSNEVLQYIFEVNIQCCFLEAHKLFKVNGSWLWQVHLLKDHFLV